MLHSEIKAIIGRGDLRILDREYSLPTREEALNLVSAFIRYRGLLRALIALLHERPTNKQIIDKVISSINTLPPDDFAHEKDDCDNSAWEMVAWFRGKGWPVGFVLIPGHAIVVIVVQGDIALYFESETGAEIAKPSKILEVVMP